MNYLMRLLCIWFTKTLGFFCRLIGHNGTNAAGKIVVRMYPEILTDLSKQVREKIIAVCGTNGKTTTNNLIYKTLTDSGKSVVCNNLGANMIEGVIVAFINKADIFGRLNADFACIEIDEGYAVRVFDYMNPDIVLLTNLFRDQLDRYGEIDITAEKLDSAFKKLSNTTLLLNADDPLCVQFSKKENLPMKFFGIDCDLGIESDETKEGRFCPVCGKQLEYDRYYYSQLGIYRCPNCDFGRPKPDFEAANIHFENGLEFEIANTHVSLNYRGLYNIYNVLAAFSVFDICGLDKKKFSEILKTYKPQVGRMEEFKISGKTVVLNLSKNPAGFNQAISTVLLDKSDKDAVIVINDGLQDGTDVSWLWDVDFEKLSADSVKNIITSGIRCRDMYLRLKYSDMENIENNPDVKSAICELIKTENRILYVLVNYTALFPTHKILTELSESEELK